MVYDDGGESGYSLILKTGPVRGGAVHYDHDTIFVLGDKGVGKPALETFYLLPLELAL